MLIVLLYNPTLNNFYLILSYIILDSRRLDAADWRYSQTVFQCWATQINFHWESFKKIEKYQLGYEWQPLCPLAYTVFINGLFLTNNNETAIFVTVTAVSYGIHGVLYTSD